MAAPGPRLTFNTHLHVPPNFSAFTTVEDAVETVGQGRREGHRHLQLPQLRRLRPLRRGRAAQHGLKALFGLEFISVMDEAMRADMTVNDPANPGRAYICGKGIPSPSDPGARGRGLHGRRQGRPTRPATRRMVDLTRELYAQAGLELDVTYDSIVELVCERANVPAEWVILQERHVALGFQEALFAALPVDQRPAFLEKLYGQPAKAAAGRRGRAPRVSCAPG